MANSAAVGASAAPVATNPGGGGNPFQIVTNNYAEKNNLGAFAGILGASTQAFGGPINAGNYLRALRLLIRTTTPGVAGTLTDTIWKLFSNLVMTNVDGSEILYSMNGLSQYLAHKYGRPFDTDPVNGYDYDSSANTPAGTLVLKPEVRWTAGVLANTDTRSQYRFDGNINTEAGFGTGFTTAPTVSVTPYMDAYAQPDSTDLQGQPNQPVPPGVNLQVKRRHQIFPLNPAGSDNTFLSTLTGNALRLMILVARDGNGVRQDALSDPILWTQDNRSMGRLSPDIVFQWAQDLYQLLNRSPRETGVYVFPRFLNTGALVGQGWLYTSNATKLQWESATAAGITGSGTVELISDEVYPVGPVDPSLVDI